MSEVPSSYLIDKALKAKQAADLQEAHESIGNRHEIQASLVAGLIAPEEPEKQGELTVLEGPSMLEKIEASMDVTLSDLEKKLTEKQLKFAWALARAKITGKQNYTQCALEAGYSEASASKEGSRLARDPTICRVAAERMPAEMRLKAVKDRPGDFVLESAILMHQKATQAVPVLDKNNCPTGHYVYDAATALRSLELIARITGVDKNKVEIGGDPDGSPVKVDSRVVATTVLDLSERIRMLGSKRPPPVEDVK